METTLNLRRRVALWAGDPHRDEIVVARTVPATELALLLCDMWDVHWCHSASVRCAALAERMAPLLTAARAAGVQIIHAPSECMQFYADTPQRQRMQHLPHIAPAPASDLPLPVDEPPLPIDDSDHGCDDLPPCPTGNPWTKQHAAIEIAADDVISDDGAEIYSLLRQQGRTLLLSMGVHTNMCILNRSFGIRQMSRWGVRCALVRDMTDAMYNPRSRPYVDHDAGTRLVIEHIERYWCPTILSDDLM